MGDIEDVHRAIPYAREALSATLPGHTLWPDRLIDLAFLLGQRFERTRDPSGHSLLQEGSGSDSSTRLRSSNQNR